MRPTQSYAPLQRGAAESSELKFAFDLDLLRRTGEVTGGEIDDVSESNSSPWMVELVSPRLCDKQGRQVLLHFDLLTEILHCDLKTTNPKCKRT